ncbi:hypothetical protein [Sulfuriferula multivorans]|uniref:hypothetical protein n=1 Tax=Sulfuriferula multivorans TaxID=1559896 RepID=UPI000F5C199E|nr:hypothetical protein [Sulfuriferula multivorans]
MNHLGHGFALVLSSALIGCSTPNPTGQKLENCWSPDTKQTTSSLVTNIANEYIDDLVKKEMGASFNDASKKRIAEHSKVNLSDFYVSSRNAEADHLTCGASIHFAFTKDDGQVISGETSTEFDIFKGENGFIYSIQKAPIMQMINSAT